MNRTMLGFLLTAIAWIILIGMYALIEWVRGHVPFAMLRWEIGGKFITLVIISVLLLGTAVGYASDQIQKQKEKR